MTPDADALLSELRTRRSGGLARTLAVSLGYLDARHDAANPDSRGVIEWQDAFGPADMDMAELRQQVAEITGGEG